MAKRVTKEVEVAEKATSSSTVRLLVNVAFSDKYDLSKHYKIGDVIEVDKVRANELLADSRNLVSKA